MKSRAPWATSLALAISFAACQSLRTQTGPEVTSDPAAIDRTPATIASASQSAELPASPLTPPATPTPAPKPRQHDYTQVDVDGTYIAITFDDGPHATLTPQLLDMLKERGIHATFFVVGQNAAEYPEILKRMAAEGHEIGNHSWSHPALTRLGAEAVKSQLDRTNNAVAKATGRAPVVMRPPYGATSAKLNRRFDEDYGLKVILWSVDPLDWRYRNASRVTQQILSQTGPGGIILAHDIHASTVAAMPATFDGLLAKGFKFVTVSQLLAMENGRANTPAPAVTEPGVAPVATAGATPFVVERLGPLEAPAPLDADR